MRTVVIIVLLLAVAWVYYQWQTTGQLPFVEQKSESTGDSKLDKWQAEIQEVEREIHLLEENNSAKTARSGYTYERYRELHRQRDELRRRIKIRRERLGLPAEE